MAKWFKADLHIHSTLSPCGSLYMSPKAIVERAREKGLDMVAVTDHNSCDNLPYVARVAQREGIALVPGVELQTEEEVHILAYFETLEAALSFREELYPYLPPVKNDPDYFGDQVVVDEEDNIVKVEEKLLVNSLLLSVDQCVEMVERYGGVVVPAHVDRETYGIIGQLGFVPDYLGFRAVEISRAVTPREALARWPELEKYTLVGFSDAHYLEDIGKVETHFYMGEPSWGELVEALADRERVRIVRPEGDETG